MGARSRPTPTGRGIRACCASTYTTRTPPRRLLAPDAAPGAACGGGVGQVGASESKKKKRRVTLAEKTRNRTLDAVLQVAREHEITKDNKIA